MRTGYRLAAVCLLLTATLGLAVHYGATEPWPYPDGEDLAAEPDAHDGERVLLFGTVEVVDRDEGTLTMSVEVDGASVPVDEVAVEVRDVEAAALAAVEPGGTVQVYGTLREGASVQTADEVVLVERSGGDRLRKYGFSVVGGLLAAGLFWRDWRIDPRRVRFVPRGQERRDAESDASRERNDASRERDDANRARGER